MSKYSVPLSKVIEAEGYEVIYMPKPAEEIEITTMEVSRPGLILARYDVNFKADRIQFIGNAEQLYITGLKDIDGFTAEQLKVICADRLLSEHPVAIVFSSSVTDDFIAYFKKHAEKFEVPLLKTADETSFAVSSLVSYLNVELADRETRHGVLVEVYGEGVLITGASGVGKSENVVELINRGHRLVADDAVEIRKVSKKTLVGSAPDNIRHFIELRGVGIVDARRLFGVKSVKDTTKIDLILNLELWDETKNYERIGIAEETEEILGIKVPSCTVPVSPGRNLAVIIEVAAVNNRQKKMGYNSAKDLFEGLGMVEDAAEIETPKAPDPWHS